MSDGQHFFFMDTAITDLPGMIININDNIESNLNYHAMFHGKNSFLIVLKGLLTTKMLLKLTKRLSRNMKGLLPSFLRSTVQTETPGFSETDPNRLRRKLTTVWRKMRRSTMRTENSPKNFM